MGSVRRIVSVRSRLSTTERNRSPSILLDDALQQPGHPAQRRTLRRLINTLNRLKPASCVYRSAAASATLQSFDVALRKSRSRKALIMPTPAHENDTGSPWHAGELALQRRAGVARQMDDVGRRVVRDHLIDQHREFYPLIPFVALGAVDADGDAWATLLAGEPGFMHAPTPDAMRVNAMRDPRDPASAGIRDGAAIALIGVELHTRRRNRLNGVVSHSSERGFDIAVRQSFGNCNRYIQARQFEFVREPALPSAHAPVHLSRLDARAASLIAAADTFFVASYVERGGGRREVDVSHRGGKRGFVRLGENGVLTVPDFSGNLFFNTLGNFLSNPKAGLVFADFESGDVLQLTGEAEVDLDSPEIATFRGAERLWRFTPRRIVYRAGAMPLRWTLPEDGVSLFDHDRKLGRERGTRQGDEARRHMAALPDREDRRRKLGDPFVSSRTRGWGGTDPSLGRPAPSDPHLAYHRRNAADPHLYAIGRAVRRRLPDQRQARWCRIATSARYAARGRRDRSARACRQLHDRRARIAPRRIAGRRRRRDADARDVAASRPRGLAPPTDSSGVVLLFRALAYRACVHGGNRSAGRKVARRRAPHSLAERYRGRRRTTRLRCARPPRYRRAERNAALRRFRFLRLRSIRIHAIAL